MGQADLEVIAFREHSREGVHSAREPDYDKRRADDAPANQDRHVQRQPIEPFDGNDRRACERRRHHQSEPAPAQSIDVPRRGRRHVVHRWMESCSPEGQVARKKQEVERAVLDIARLQCLDGEQRIGGEGEQEAGGEKPIGDGPRPGGHHQPDDDGHQEQVGQRVCDGCGDIQHAEARVLQIRVDQEGPRCDSNARGDDQCIDQALSVAAGRACSNHEQQRHDDRWVGRQVRQVRDRWEGRLPETVEPDVPQNVATEVEQLCKGEQQPRQSVLGTVDHDPGDDRKRGGEGQEVVDRCGCEGRQQQSDHGEGTANDQQQPPRPCNQSGRQGARRPTPQTTGIRNEHPPHSRSRTEEGP